MSKLSLSALNTSSAKSGGKWNVGVYHPYVDTYEYTWGSQQREGKNFVCLLVSLDNPEEYCTATLKKTNAVGPKFNQAPATYTEGKTFQMSKVVLVADAKSQYISTPLKQVVDLTKTTMQLGVDATAGLAQPSPSTTVANCSKLQANQYFDVTALVRAVGEIRSYQQGRSGFSVEILDGSLDETSQKTKVMPLMVYFDTERESTWKEAKALLEDCLKSKQAVSFFCIQGNKDSNEKFSFRTTRNSWFVKAIGHKADLLNGRAELHNLSEEHVEPFLLRQASRNWSQEQGKETCCKLLATFAQQPTGIAALDAGETLWQLNWLRVTPPSPTDDIKTKGGERLFFPLPMWDGSGHLTLRITEKPALQLAKVSTMEEFEQFQKEERLHFPMWVSAKVLRRPSKSTSPDASSAGQPADAFDCFVVDAAEQTFENAPTVESTKMLTLLDARLNNPDIVLPAALGMVHKSEHYALAVQYTAQTLPDELSHIAPSIAAPTVGATIVRPCGEIICLVESTSRSKPEKMEGGYKLVTENVSDLTYTGDVAAGRYTVTSFCTLDTVTDYKLDPARGQRSQAALISIAGVLEKDSDSAGQPVTNLLTNNVQLLTSSEAEALKLVMRKMIYFATTAAQMSSRKRSYDGWTEEESPAKAAACRTLGRSPTGPQLPEYKP